LVFAIKYYDVEKTVMANTIPPISTNRTTTSQFKSLNKQKKKKKWTAIFGVGRIGPSLGQAQTRGGVELVNEFPIM
jgi:hypothetical protein